MDPFGKPFLCKKNNVKQCYSVKSLHFQQITAILEIVDGLELSLDDFKKSLEGFLPQSMSAVKFTPSSNATFNDVGGLEDIKSALTRIIEYPAKVIQAHNIT